MQLHLLVRCQGRLGVGTGRDLRRLDDWTKFSQANQQGFADLGPEDGPAFVPQDGVSRDVHGPSMADDMKTGIPTGFWGQAVIKPLTYLENIDKYSMKHVVSH